MKFFSVIFIIFLTLSVGYFFIVFFPEKVRVGVNSNSDYNEASKISESIQAQKLILRDKCNTYVMQNEFKNSTEADTFLESCLTGGETSKINVIGGTISSSSASLDEYALTHEERLVKCTEFLKNAKFESDKARDTFYNSCIQGE